ncbi:MAG: GTP-binding protein [Clostridia bacterium]|nr:GTP-binding protein [Clostridia bacterium]
MKSTRSIGIFAHVDSGKTTLSERLLTIAGAIRKTGSVDHGTAHTDRLDVERRRGISVQSACAPLQWKGARINLIDTPGHSDFAAEIERSMWVLDAAVLLVSGPDGVQPQAELLIKNLRAQRIPTLIFVNKMDRCMAAPEELAAEIRKKLDSRIVPYSDDEALMALLAESDEQALSDYMDGVIYPRDTLEEPFRKAFMQ